MINAVVFDLDGVIVSTDEFHYLAWQKLADTEGIPFDRTVNHRLRGVSRNQCLEIILERAARKYSEAQKSQLATRKNNDYLQRLESLTASAILPGVAGLLAELKKRGIRVAVASASRNCLHILEKIGLSTTFDAIVDGNQITKTKPDPEVFLQAAKALGLPPENCLVVEDAEAGVRAAVAAKMPVLAIGAAAGDARANRCAPDLAQITVDDLLGMGATSAVSIAKHETELDKDRFGRPAGLLIDRHHGAVKGFCIGISYYDSEAYNPPGVHEDQEGFFILEGTGMAKVGDSEFHIRPGLSFIAARGVPHAMKRDPDSAPIKVLWMHGAVA